MAMSATQSLSAQWPSRRAVELWLALICAMIFVMVLLGGATRLTGSGLSMVEWQPLSILPPLTQAEWQETFAKYQSFPEFLKKNSWMTLQDFKGIFWLEYVHRLWGRLIGAVVLLPLIYFAARGAIDGKLAKRLAVIFVLGGLQGALGWFMVASGLNERPEVSPYRLAAHLGLAVVLFGALAWLALTVRAPDLRMMRIARVPAAFAGLVLLTILSGAFVVGLDAGLTYNTFPLMDGRLIPSGWGALDPWWRNLFENVTAVQFDHRVLALTTVACALALRVWLHGKLPTRKAERAADAVAAMALVQAGLGVATLLLVVPVSLGVIHQGGALVLLGSTLWLLSELRTGTPHG